MTSIRAAFEIADWGRRADRCQTAIAVERAMLCPWELNIGAALPGPVEATSSTIPIDMR